MSDKATDQDPGWHADPHGLAALRYWSGTGWSDWVSDGDKPYRRGIADAVLPVAVEGDSAPTMAATVSIVRRKVPGHVLPGAPESESEPRSNKVPRRPAFLAARLRRLRRHSGRW